MMTISQSMLLRVIFVSLRMIRVVGGGGGEWGEELLFCERLCEEPCDDWEVATFLVGR